MNCPSQHQIDEYLNGSTGDLDQGMLETHLAECPTCRATLDRKVQEGERLDRLIASSFAADVDVGQLPEGWQDRLRARASCMFEQGRSSQSLQIGEFIFPEGPTPQGPLGKVGHYHIKSRLGRGGFGTVYHAWDERVSRSVALKILSPAYRPELAPSDVALREECRKRFQREARLASQIKSDHVVEIYHVGEFTAGDDSDPVAFVEMELLDGGTLRELLRAGGKLSSHTIAEIVWQIAMGVGAAHAQGIVHRDLKPENVLFDGRLGVTAATSSEDARDNSKRPWRAKIADFGVATLANPPSLADRLTQEGFAPGTLGYMSPEQAIGSREVGASSDVYSLGVMLYEMLSGELPFRGGAQEVIDQKRTCEPASLRDQNRQIPRDLDTITQKCLRLEPSRRYSNGEDVAQDLRRFLECRPILARPVGMAERAWLSARRNPLVTTTISLMVAAILVTVVVSVTAGIVGTRQASREKKLREVAQDREQITHRHLYDAQIERIPRTIDAGHMSLVRDLLDATRPAQTGGTDFRGWEWYFFHGKYRAETTRFDGHAHPICTAVASPDGRRVASADTSGAIVIWDAETGRETTRLAGIPGGTYALAFDSQARRLAAAGAECDVVIYELTGDTSQRSLVGHALSVHHLAFSPDDELLATAGNDNTVKLWDVASGVERQTLLGHHKAVCKVWFSRDGARLASLDFAMELQIWSLPEGERVTRRTAIHPQAALSHDLKTVATWNKKELSLELIDVASGVVTRRFPGQTTPFREMAFSPDDRLLALATQDGDAVAFDVTADALTAVYRAQVRTIAFSASGDHLVGACADQFVRIWPAKAPDADHFNGHGTRISSLAMSPSGQWIASGDVHGSIRIWNAESGASVRVLGTHVEVPDRPDVDLATKPPLHDGMPPRNLLHMTQPNGSGYSVLVYQGHSAEVTAVTFSCDGQTLASLGGQEARLWNVATGQELRVFNHPQVAAGLALSPDGKKLATGCWDDLVRVWDAESGRELHKLAGHEDNVYAVAFHRNGRWLASAGEDAVVRLWDADSGALLSQAKGHSARINALAFSPDGTMLASGGDDLIIRLWDVDATHLTLRHELHGQTHDVTQLVFHPTEDRLVSSSDWLAVDATVRFWDVKLGREIVALPAPRNRNFGLAFDPTGDRLALAAGTRIQVWRAFDRAKVEPPVSKLRNAATPIARDVRPEERPLKVLGWYRADRLPQRLDKKSAITPAKTGESFWLAVVSLPHAALYPTDPQLEHLRLKSVKDPSEPSNGPRSSYALFDPSRFVLHPPQGEPIRATAVAPLPWPYTDKVAGFSRGIVVELSTATLQPRGRSLIAVAFELSADQTGPLRIRFGNDAPVLTPALELKDYRGDYVRERFVNDRVNSLRMAQMRTFGEY